MYRALILAAAILLHAGGAAGKVIEEIERAGLDLSTGSGLFEIGATGDLYDSALEAISRGDLPTAHTQLSAIRLAQPDTLGRWELEGLLLLVEGNPAAAEKSLRRALTLDDSVSSVWSKLGAALLAQGQVRSGRDAHRKAVELDSGNVFSLHMLARLAAASGDARLAENRYRETLAQLGPDYSSVHQELALLLLNTDQPKDAIEILEPVAATSDQATASLLLARAQGAAGETEAALKTVESVLDKHGDELAAWTGAGSVLLEVDDVAAVSTLNKGLRRFPDDPLLRFQLANAHDIGDRRGEAIEGYRALLDDPHVRVLALNNLALLLAEDEATAAEALDLARQAAEQVPESPPIQDTLGWVLYKNGKAEEGLPHLRNAASRLAGDAEMTCHLAIVTAEVEGLDNARSKLMACAGSDADRALIDDAVARLSKS